MNHLDPTTLNLFFDDALDPAARALAQAHLSACADCRRDLDALHALSVTFDSWRAEPIPNDVSVPVMRRIANRPTPVVVARWGAVLLGVEALLAAALLVRVLPLLLSLFGASTLDSVPAFDFDAMANLLETTRTWSLPVPSFGIWIWVFGLLGGAVVWLVGNRLVLHSVENSLKRSREVSQ